MKRDGLNPDVANALAVFALTGSLTDGISGSIQQHCGLTDAPCPVCSHVVMPVGMGFALADSKDMRASIMCGQCCTFLFITPFGLVVISAEEFAALPQDARTLLERIRKRVRRSQSLL